MIGLCLCGCSNLGQAKRQKLGAKPRPQDYGTLSAIKGPSLLQNTLRVIKNNENHAVYFFLTTGLQAANYWTYGNESQVFILYFLFFKFPFFLTKFTISNSVTVPRNNQYGLVIKWYNYVQLNKLYGIWIMTYLLLEWLIFCLTRLIIIINNDY